MKQQTNRLVAMAFLMAVTLLATAAQAAPHAILRLEKGKTAKSIDLQLANLQKKRTLIAVQDLDGKRWFSEFITEDGYAKTLHLENLPAGQYLCLVKNADDQLVQAFSLSADNLDLYEQTPASNSGAPVLVHTGSAHPSIVRVRPSGSSTVGLQLANLQQQDVLIQLHTLNDGVAFEQRLNGRAGYAEQLDFKGLPDGTYLLYLELGNARVMQTLRFGPAGIEPGPMERLDAALRNESVVLKS